jgi:biopolymer transport protein ExbD
VHSAKAKTLPSVDDITVLIKPLTTASYQNVVAALDEMQINGVTNFMLVEASTEEKAWLQTH